MLVAWRGATLGHAYANIWVVDARTGKIPSFLRAVGRFWIKGLLGLFAFVFMASTRRHQALHDLLFLTTVEIRDPARASRYDYLTERLPDSERVPAAAWRRVLMILCYSVGCVLLYGFVLAATESRECFEENRCSGSERAWEAVVTLLWVGAQTACLAYGWQGRLIGARSRKVLATPPSTVNSPGHG